MPATLQFQVPSTKAKTATVSEYLEKLTQRLKLTHNIAIQSSNSRHQRNKRLYEKKLTQHQFEGINFYTQLKTVTQLWRADDVTHSKAATTMPVMR
ncbi:putative methylmalonate-semialdehyde dehydrogenase [acylating], mitochondrial [Amphibalanus amphitrite]|uniref:Putative methylmalonate-semialdehyde dehydrogenase [acylating], mitochondrial n=1 Tax=Amphibalanus amphitrite TaxID=1232801 RepID=A0A6A4W2Z5_AMPAM|nr:putative methylmalonate-semialdehyde dehydrogenase [acylating], mitochondrial [Amphibalanus amphitrite]